jgi:uncharacterized protein YutE (UPF0331/DUF86 family)
VTREVLVRKLDRLRSYLDALRPHADRSPDDLAADPWAVERLLELLVQVAVDITNHELAERDIVPGSYREAFRTAGDEGLLPSELADSLAEAAGMRNILVHMYETIDYEIVADAVDQALTDFSRFLQVYGERLDDHGD